MPTNEPIANVIIPKEAPKPIPERIVHTRPAPKPEIPRQETTGRSEPVAESTTPEESVKLAPQLSALARKEQAFRQRELALKQREQDLEAKLANAEKFENLQTKIGAKDFSSAEELGLSYEEYTNYLLNKQAGEDPQTQAFKKLEDEIQSLKQGQEERATREYEETVAEYRTELSTMITTSPEFLKLSKLRELDANGKEFGAVDVALQNIIDSWDEDGEELSVEQALREVKLFFDERAKRYAALIDEAPAEVEERKLPPPRTGPRTLTNQMQPSGETKTAKPSYQHMSENERYQAARAAVLARRQKG